jgi:hypothetical protein
MDRATEMFVPVVDAVASLNGEPLAEELDAILVNRFYLRGIEQIDRRTGQQHQKMPGTTFGS